MAEKKDGWPKKLKKGRFTSWCKRNGFDGPSAACAKKAMQSDDASVRGMASFYMNTVKPSGKTARVRAKDGYKPSTARKTERANKDRELRNQMRGR